MKNLAAAETGFNPRASRASWIISAPRQFQSSCLLPSSLGLPPVPKAWKGLPPQASSLISRLMNRLMSPVIRPMRVPDPTAMKSYPLPTLRASEETVSTSSPASSNPLAMLSAIFLQFPYLVW